jgi:hypothetical protein
MCAPAAKRYEVDGIAGKRWARHVAYMGDISDVCLTGRENLKQEGRSGNPGADGRLKTGRQRVDCLRLA